MTVNEMVENLRVHRFEPGDRLVMKVPEHWRHDDAERMKAIAEKWAGVPVLVVPDTVEVEAARGLSKNLPPEPFVPFTALQEAFVAGQRWGSTAKSGSPVWDEAKRRYPGEPET